MKTKKMAKAIFGLLVGLLLLSIAATAQAIILGSSNSDSTGYASQSAGSQYNNANVAFTYNNHNRNDDNNNDDNNDGKHKGKHKDKDKNVVPIPAALWLLGSGLIGLAVLRRRTKS